MLTRQHILQAFSLAVQRTSQVRGESLLWRVTKRFRELLQCSVEIFNRKIELAESEKKGWEIGILLSRQQASLGFEVSTFGHLHFCGSNQRPGITRFDS